MSKLTCLFSLLLLSSLGLFAQQVPDSKPDSLRASLHDRISDLDRLNTYFKLASFYSKKLATKSATDSASFYYATLLKLAQSSTNIPSKSKITVLRAAGIFYLNHGEKNKGIQNFKEVFSLQHAAKNAEEEINTISAFVLAFIANFPHQKDEVKPFLYHARALSKQFKTMDKEVYYRYFVSQTFIYCDYVSEAESDCQEVIRKYKNKNTPFLVDCYFLIAKTHRYWGNLNKALFYALEGMKTIQPETPTTRQSIYTGELGQIYQDLGLKEKSIEYYRKTIQLREQEDVPLKYVFRTAGFIVQQLIQLKKPTEALREITALEKRHQIRSQFDEATILQIKAYCYAAVGKSEKAEQYYLKMLTLFTKDDEFESVCLGKYDIAKFYVHTKQYQKASPFLKELSVYHDNISRLKDVLLLEFKVDSAAGNYTIAIQKLHQFMALKDSIFNEAKSKQIEELQIQYDTQQKTQAINLLKRDNLIQQTSIKNAKIVRNLTFLALAILILFLLLLYYSFRQKQKNNSEISKKNSDLHQLVTEKELLIKEVHHRVKNNLQIVMGLLRTQSSYIDNKKALTAIKNSENRMHSIALIHQKLYQNEAMVLINLPSYINDVISYLKDSYQVGTQINFYKEIGNYNVDVSQAVPLGLIINEAIANAIKHAFHEGQYGNIHICVNENDEEQLLLRISDNGKGISPNLDLNTVNSMGMNLMRGLSKQLGGKLTIDSIQGVTISVIFKRRVFSFMVEG